MTFWDYIGAFIIIVMVATIVTLIVTAIFEFVWNHLFYYIFDSIFNYEIPLISYKQSFAILLAITIVNLLFIKV
ncbi:hypothetical protein ERK19_01125 [Lactobacillus helsingborgensis]|uniref:hypothetical protein n=1 Tax=Lactobacillus helsingborgensis TaxID=1218494 RepID=UPI00165027BD|nr:hypothetical protein [Lactobacillus helsingborgensis]MBC6355982.1 hypothetical protein [Lactobacillus helsingborgensis]